ncbi:uncharacterized protein LOC6575436 [Drosophila mojavensis]|uniref:Uncharacterized protein n=1 Tax=Drosophila mojavensis TaxID=7230 RepID=B4KC33_DROMO|nr:uncharacterized protein LOC6575436 [Drosophila mojavensis]EDW16906.1 uncharacterized protein Dmoj_GI10797 [Drosophila mojavensis]
MNSSTKLFACALIAAQLLVAVHGGVFDFTDRWVDSDKAKPFPENAVLGGYDSEGYENYVGRIIAASSVLPARVRAETGYATYNSDSVSNQANSYDLLVSNETLSYEWVRSFDGFREKNPVSVGTSVTNERVYICRARTDGGLFIGTLYLSQRACFIRYENWPMRRLTKYEVLVRKLIPAPSSTFEVQVN